MYRQIYNKILSQPIIVLAIVQLFFVLLVFHQIIFDPNAYMFTNVYDGLKNYFTFTQFIAQEPSSLGEWHFTQMNYPFGEYVFFTDNTPLLSKPLRWMNSHLFSIENNSIAIHNYFFLFNLLCTPLLFFVLIRDYAYKRIILAMFLAIAFAWINPQLLKLQYGIFNLSLTVIMLTLMIILRRIHTYWTMGNRNEGIKISAYIFLLIFISAFAHIYYIPLLALPIGLFVFGIFIQEGFRRKTFRWKSLFGFVLSPLLGGVSFYFLMQFIDKYSELRRATASGFDWDLWKFTPEAILTPYHFNDLFPLVRSCKTFLEIPQESHGFWSNFTWAVFLFSFIYFLYLVLREKKSVKSILKKATSNSYFLALFITMVISYATASGTYIRLCIIPLSFDNILSPFYFLHDHIDMITQFRCLGRFSWIAFWIISLFACILFFKLIVSLARRNRRLGLVVGVILIAILLVDVFNSMVFQSTVRTHNVFKKDLLEEKFEPLNEIDFSTYQAIYTIPAVQVGSENYDITIDDQPGWTRFWMQLSAYSKLPLFNCKMSRTAENQAKAQVDLLLEQKVPSLILEEVNDKPVLVVYSPENEEQFDMKILDYARPAVENGSQIIKAFQMDTILVENKVYYLSWDIKNNN